MQISRGPKWDQEYWGTFYSWQGAELQVWTNWAALSRAIGMGLSIPGENIVSFFNIFYINLGEQVLFNTSLGKVIQHKVNSTFSFHKSNRGITNFQHTLAPGNVSIPNGRNRDKERKNQTKTRLELYGASTKYHSSGSGILGPQCQDVSFKGFRRSAWNFAGCCSHGCSLRPALWMACCLPQQAFHIPGL